MDDERQRIKRHFVESVDALVALRDAHDADLATLRAEVERLKELMRPFFDDFEGVSDKPVVVFVPRADFDRARAALEEGE